MQNVVVLMSTYNGEAYLKEQINSILEQEAVTVTLLVRDDGSTDGTKEILQEYEEAGKLKILPGENLGVGNSFMELIYHAPQGDYYAFADQDDIWLSQKLSKAVEKLVRENVPCVYTSNQMVTDAVGNPKGLRFDRNPPQTLFQIIDRSELSGCTMVMNQALYKIITEEARRPSAELLKKRIHDVWVLLAASACGKVIYDSESYILYRQHGNNVVGVQKIGLGKRIRLYAQVIFGKKDGNVRSRTAHEVRRCFEDIATKEACQVLKLYENVNSCQGKYSFCKSSYIRQVVGSPWMFKLKVWLGLI